VPASFRRHRHELPADQFHPFVFVDDPGRDHALDFGDGESTASQTFGVREVWVIDAVRLTTRTFHAPSASGYGQKRDFRAAEPIVPLFAPAEFSLRLDELELI
jgi:hypothetical protein